MTTRRTHAAAEAVSSPLAAIPVVTIIVLVLLVTGCIDILIDGSLSQGYYELVKVLGIPLAGLAAGRGLDQIHRP